MHLSSTLATSTSAPETEAGSELSDFDVVICGGGPTGLVMALGLLDPNIKVLILNKHITRHPMSRAMVIWPRNVESFFFCYRELFDRFASATLSVTTWCLALGNRYILEVPLQGLFQSKVAAMPWFIPQGDTEQMLEDHIMTHHESQVIFKKGWSLEHINVAETQQTSGSPLTLTVREVKTGSIQEVRTHFLLGCDGSRSTVRTETGLGFDFLAAQYAGWLTDAKLTYSQRSSGPKLQRVENKTLFVSTPTGMAGFFPMHDGLIRVVLPVSLKRVDESNAVAPSREEINEKLAALETHHSFKLWDVPFSSAFRVRFGLATKYLDQSARIFLAGDAAHVHSPVGGQGMNLGMQDAFNLSWKIRMCVKHASVLKAPELLLSYEAERRPLAKHVVGWTYGASRFFFGEHSRFTWWVVAQFTRVFYKLAIPRWLRAMSQLHGDYSGTPLCVDDWQRRKWYCLWDCSGVRAGRCMPLSEVKQAPDFQQRVLLATLCKGDGFSVLYFPPLIKTDTQATSRSALLAHPNIDGAWNDFCGRFRTFKFQSLVANIFVIGKSTPEVRDWDRSTFCTDPEARDSGLLQVHWLEDVDSRAAFVGNSVESCIYVVRPDFFVGYRSRPFSLQSLCHWFKKFSHES